MRSYAPKVLVKVPKARLKKLRFGESAAQGYGFSYSHGLYENVDDNENLALIARLTSDEVATIHTKL